MRAPFIVLIGACLNSIYFGLLYHGVLPQVEAKSLLHAMAICLSEERR